MVPQELRSEVRTLLKELYRLLRSYQGGTHGFSRKNVLECSELLAELGSTHIESLDAISATREGLPASYRGDAKSRVVRSGGLVRFPDYDICSFSTSLAIAYDFAYSHKDSFLYSGRDIVDSKYEIDVYRFNEFVDVDWLSTIGYLSTAEDEIVIVGCELRAFDEDEFLVGQSKNLHKRNPRKKSDGDNDWKVGIAEGLAEMALIIPGIPPL